jgi:hypothetical protein
MNLVIILSPRCTRLKLRSPTTFRLWFGISNSIGTMGAFIRIKSIVRSRVVFFDIGIAGPLAGFIAALVVLWYGFTHLPPPEYIFTIHPEYARYGLSYPQFVYENSPGNIALGDNILFWLFKTYIADPARLPHAYEMIHYPVYFCRVPGAFLYFAEPDSNRPAGWRPYSLRADRKEKIQCRGSGTVRHFRFLCGFGHFSAPNHSQSAATRYFTSGCFTSRCTFISCTSVSAG